jgi:hypothetical protein
LETKEREGLKREGMSAGWPGGTKSERLHTIAGLEENKMVGKASWVANVVVPMQGFKAVAVRQEMDVGGVLGTMLVTMSMTMLVMVSVMMLVTVLVTVSVMVSVSVTGLVRTVSATVLVTGSVTVSVGVVTVLVGVSTAVVEVLGPAAAIGVLESAGGRAGTWLGHFIGLGVIIDRHMRQGIVHGARHPR